MTAMPTPVLSHAPTPIGAGIFSTPAPTRDAWTADLRHFLGLEGPVARGAARADRRLRARARLARAGRAQPRRPRRRHHRARVHRGLDAHAHVASRSPRSGLGANARDVRERGHARSTRARRCSTRCGCSRPWARSCWWCGTRSSGAPAWLARQLPRLGVVNAGDGMHEHPTQGLLDLLTLHDAWDGRFEGRRLAIVGDIAHSRVARSAIAGLTTLGARVTVCGPGTLHAGRRRAARLRGRARRSRRR